MQKDFQNHGTNFHSKLPGGHAYPGIADFRHLHNHKIHHESRRPGSLGEAIKRAVKKFN